MPVASDRPLKKTTLNLYETDVAYMVEHYGNGWTSQVRDVLERFVQKRKELKRAIDAGFNTVSERDED